MWLTLRARFMRARADCVRFVAGGLVRINRLPTDKPHARLRVGDVITFPLRDDVRVVEVLALSRRRGPAPEARLLYEDLDPPQPTLSAAKDPPVAAREDGAGRPTKRERRAIDRLHSDE